MDIEEYRNERAGIQKRAHDDLSFLAKAYAFSNNTVLVGSVIEDHMGHIKVEKIKYTSSDLPQCVYYGVELTKKMEPRKDGSRRAIYQVNVI